MSSRTGFDLHPDQCRAADVHARPRDRSGDVAVKAFAILAEGRMSPTLSAELARLRSEQHFARGAWVTIWGLRSLHRFLRLPPAATADLEALSLQEARHDLAALEAEAGPAAVALEIGTDVQVGAHRRREVSLTAVPEAEIARQIQPVVDAGFDVRGVFTPAMALAAVARHHERTSSSATAAYVAVESNAMCVAIVRDGVLLFAREIPSGFADSADAARQRLIDEIRRSLLFFRQSFRDVVQRVVLCGGMSNLRALTAPASAALNVPVETLDSLSAIDAAAVPEPADAFRAAVAALWPAIAIASEGSARPNLLRPATRPRRVTRTTMMGAVAAVAAGILALGAWYAIARPAQRNRASEVARLERRVALLEQEVQRSSTQRDGAQSTTSPPPVPQLSSPKPPAAAATAEPALVLGSILYSPQRRLAIVNGRIVRIGDRIGSATILDIEPRAVIVVSPDGTRRTLELGRR